MGLYPGGLKVGFYGMPGIPNLPLPHQSLPTFQLNMDSYM